MGVVFTAPQHRRPVEQRRRDREQGHRSMEQGRRRGAASRVWATLAALLLGLLVPLLTATGAQAHAVLRSISPTNGAQLTKAPTQVVLTFDEAVSTSFATVA